MLIKKCMTTRKKGLLKEIYELLYFLFIDTAFTYKSIGTLITDYYLHIIFVTSINRKYHRLFYTRLITPFSLKNGTVKIKNLRKKIAFNCELV